MNPRRSFEGARCLVTGAESGPGRAIAEHLARQGASVLLTGRSLEPLEATARRLADRGIPAGSILAVDADLGEPEGRGKVIHAAATRFGALDLAVDAGYLEGDAAEPDETARAFLPLLKLGERPTLATLAAIAPRSRHAGKSPTPARESAPARFAESIRGEWSKFGIHILQVNLALAATDPEADRAATRTLAAIRRGIPELTLAPEGRLIRLAHRLPGFNRPRPAHSPSQDLPAAKPSLAPTWAAPTPPTRLPRPHFDLRIPKPSRKGD